MKEYVRLRVGALGSRTLHLCRVSRLCARSVDVQTVVLYRFCQAESYLQSFRSHLNEHAVTPPTFRKREDCLLQDHSGRLSMDESARVAYR